MHTFHHNRQQTIQNFLPLPHHTVPAFTPLSFPSCDIAGSFNIPTFHAFSSQSCSSYLYKHHLRQIISSHNYTSKQIPGSSISSCFHARSIRIYKNHQHGFSCEKYLKMNIDDDSYLNRKIFKPPTKIDNKHPESSSSASPVNSSQNQDSPSIVQSFNIQNTDSIQIKSHRIRATGFSTSANQTHQWPELLNTPQSNHQESAQPTQDEDSLTMHSGNMAQSRDSFQISRTPQSTPTKTYPSSTASIRSLSQHINIPKRPSIVNPLGTQRRKQIRIFASSHLQTRSVNRRQTQQHWKQAQQHQQYQLKPQQQQQQQQQLVHQPQETENHNPSDSNDSPSASELNQGQQSNQVNSVSTSSSPSVDSSQDKNLQGSPSSSNSYSTVQNSKTHQPKPSKKTSIDDDPVTILQNNVQNLMILSSLYSTVAANLAQQFSNQVSRSADVAEELADTFIRPLGKLRLYDNQQTFPPHQLADKDSVFKTVGKLNLCVHSKVVDGTGYVNTYDDSHIHHQSHTNKHRARLNLLMLHGMLGSTFSWRLLQPKVAKFFRGTCVSYDRPAFGLTSRPQKKEWRLRGLPNPYTNDYATVLTEQMMNAYNFDDCILVGHSYGCAVAIMTALRYPSRVKALILLSPCAKLEFPRFFRTDEIARRVLSTPILGTGIIRARFELMTTMQEQRFVNQIKRIYHNIEDFDIHELLDGYAKPMRVRDWDSAFAEFSLVFEPFNLINDQLKHLKIPSLVISADSDRVISAKDMADLAIALPNAEHYIIKNCGHNPQEEKPDEVMAIIENWADRVL